MREGLSCLVGEGLALWVAVPVVVAEGVGGDWVLVSVRVQVGVREFVRTTLGVAVAVWDGGDIVAVDRVALSLRLRLRLPVPEGVGVPLRDADGEPVSVRVQLRDCEGL